MKNERYYIFVKTTRTHWNKETKFQVKDKQDKKFLKEFTTMTDARNYKGELNNV